MGEVLQTVKFTGLGYKGKVPLFFLISVPPHTASLQNNPTHQATFHLTYRCHPFPYSNHITLLLNLHGDFKNCPKDLTPSGLDFSCFSPDLSRPYSLFPYHPPCLGAKSASKRQEYGERHTVPSKEDPY